MTDPTSIDKILYEQFPSFSDFEFIAQGGYKIVLKVRLQNGSEEVLKLIQLPSLGSSEESKAIHSQELGRAMREVTLLKECACPYVVKLGSMAPELREIQGSQCVVYTEELLPGADLQKVIESGYKPDESECKVLMKCLIESVQSIWETHGIVHRDIKPLNVFRTGIPTRPFVLLDFGIAFNINEPGLTIRTDQSPPMTRRYKAPEMADPNFRETLDYRTDLYTIGMTTFEFATGGIHPLQPKTGEDPLKTLTRILTMEPRRLLDERPEFSSEFCQLVDSTQSKRRALRPGNLKLILRKL
jgi:serine/threonine protein kinase